MLNWALLSNPANWIVVYLIIILGIVAVTFAHQLISPTGNK